MSLIAAALAADGESRVAPLETVERGYSRLVERLQATRREGDEADVKSDRSGAAAGSSEASGLRAPPGAGVSGVLAPWAAS